MIAVFGAFILANDTTTKLFGLGLALAVFLDVTLVRMILVPAAMSLLGDRAWWLPGWLQRHLPNIDLEPLPTRPDEAEEAAASDADPIDSLSERASSTGGHAAAATPAGHEAPGSLPHERP